jgi:hypothetical protein
MPKIKCSQRSAIISLASGFSRNEKCGVHAGKVSASKSKNMENLRLQTQRAAHASMITAMEHGNGTPRRNTVADIAARRQFIGVFGKKVFGAR